MHPIICQIGSITVYSYGLMLASAFLLCLFLIRHEARRQNIDPEIVSNLGIIVFICGIIGARFLFVVRNMDYYSQYPGEIIMLQLGGLSWFGGLLLAIIAGFIFLKKKKLAAYEIMDLFVPFVALAQSMGRIGCLLNGCCSGKESAAGIYFPVHKAILIPTQIYSSLLLIFIYIILRKLQQKPHLRGQIFFTYLLLYSAKRFFIEFWRDNDVIFWGLTWFQAISVLIFLLALAKLIALKLTASKR